MQLSYCSRVLATVLVSEASQSITCDHNLSVRISFDIFLIKKKISLFKIQAINNVPWKKATAFWTFDTSQTYIKIKIAYLLVDIDFVYNGLFNFLAVWFERVESVLHSSVDRLFDLLAQVFYLVNTSGRL